MDLPGQWTFLPEALSQVASMVRLSLATLAVLAVLATASDQDTGDEPEEQGEWRNGCLSPAMTTPCILRILEPLQEDVPAGLPQKGFGLELVSLCSLCIKSLSQIDEIMGNKRTGKVKRHMKVTGKLI